MTRHLLGWDRPIPLLAAEWFLARAEVVGGEVDASDQLWIFSGARAGREFLRRLAEDAQRRGAAFRPPEVATPGRLARLVQDAMVDQVEGRAPASEWELRSAWASELLAAPKDLAAPLVGAAAGDRDALAWSLAGRLVRVVAELRLEQVSPRAILDAASPAERPRWEAILRLDARVAERLAKAGLADPDALLAHAVAAGTVSPRRVVAAGVLEWTGWQRRLLERSSAVVLVAAPAERADDFDALGAVVAERWIGRAIDLPIEAVTMTATVADAAEAMLDRLEVWSREASIDEVAVGIADPVLAAPLARVARRAGMTLHLAEGESLASSSPGRAIESMTRLVGAPSAALAAAVLRHTHLAAWLGGGADLSATATEVIALRMPRSLEQLAEGCRAAEEGRRPALREEARRSTAGAIDRLRTLVERWSSARRPSAAWATEVASWLREVAEAVDRGSRELRGEGDRLRDDLAAVARVLRSIAAVDPAIESPIAAETFLDRLNEMLRRERRATTVEGDAVEGLGWLELAADLAPRLVVVGLHDGVVPGAGGGETLLPESLRRTLGLPTSLARHARDAAVLATIAARCTHLAVIVPRRAPDGSEQLPSRLLLGGEGESLAERVLAATGDPAPTLRRSLGGGSAAFAPPAPDPTRPLPEQLSPTAIRTYLLDPYRFYLRHVERLKEASEGAGELDALRFGTLAHGVFEQLGRDATFRGECDEFRLRDRLESILAEVARRSFGPRPPASVRVQLRSLRRRLGAFAAKEAQSRRAGWRTIDVEREFDEPLVMAPGEAPQRITGRLDRIDRNLDSGRYRILDYKTGDKATTPERAHRAGPRAAPRWIDLQLPLYRHLLAGPLGAAESSIEVGHVTLAGAPGDVAIRTIAAWDEGIFADAIERAREVVRAIRRREFDRAPPPARQDEFSLLCGETVLFGAELGGEDA